MSHFVAVEYLSDGKDIHGAFSDLASAFSATACRNVEEWDRTRSRRWWSLNDHDDWAEGPKQ